MDCRPRPWFPGMSVALFCAGAALVLPATAQVLRCTDARTGKVTYTDSACDAGDRSQEVQARKSPEELERERAAGEQAAQRLRERLAAEAQAAERREEREAQKARDAARNRAAGPRDHARSPACQDARRQLNAVAASSARTPEEQAARLEAAQRQMDFSCLGPEAYAQAELARANRPQVVVVQPPAWPVHPIRPRPPHPDRPGRPHIKECSAFTCTDNNGKRYPRTGRGSFEERR